ncbi:MAG: hypothetical protein JSS31_11715 [Proteobacteria bacterium]|nr:hypothetical protein [Pseudomonadota bacterium]MBS0494598.1 hypothetical protein [Pseudomonadota bacterium]
MSASHRTNGNCRIAVDNEKFLFLFNDLTAANWVYSTKEDASDADLLNSFLEIHRIFLGRLNRQEKGIFDRVPKPHLVKVVRGWASLYRCTLGLLRSQYPRSKFTKDLIIGCTNWSEHLNISAGGLIVIDHSSRYAEFWAERSIKTKEGYSSLQSRRSFVGSQAFNDYAEMVRRNEFLALDGFSNGVTSYDMMLFLRDSGCNQATFASGMDRLGWRLVRGDKTSIGNIFRIYSQLKDADLHPAQSASVL